MSGCTDNKFQYPIRIALARDHYKINFNNLNTIQEIQYEKFDYNIIKPDINPFADTLVNEMWPFFRLLWRTRGGYTAEVKFNPEIDLTEFGTQYGPAMYNAIFKFSISDEGEWSADFDFDFNQNVENPDDIYYPRPKSRKGPFYAQDYSRMTSNTAIRARKLARPTWDIETGRSDKEFMHLIKAESFLNKTTDFSFNYKYIGNGSWGDYKNYTVEIPNKKKEEKSKKESVFNISFKNIGKYKGNI
jgi:hypothetical protein